MPKITKQKCDLLPHEVEKVELWVLVVSLFPISLMIATEKYSLNYDMN